MTIYKLPEDIKPGHCWIDSDHPERGEFWARADMTEEAVAAEWESAVNPPPEVEARAASRDKRDRLLRESDWTQLPDAPVDQQRWAVYRKQLRDLDMTNPVWPEPPGNGMTDEDRLRVERHLDKAARTILFDGKNKT